MKFKKYIIEAVNPKFPRTYHLPWSEEVHSDDKTHSDVSFLLNKPLTITTKMDGSNVGISFDLVSSRSGDVPKHKSFDMLKQKVSTIKHDIPENMVIYGEWLYAKHSIEYDNLDDYLLSFAILDKNKWLSWKDVVEWSKLLNIKTVNVIKNNIKFKNLNQLQEQTTKIARQVISRGHEGIVIRLSGSFTDYTKSTAKFVRKGHVQTDKHWMFKDIKVNKLK
jgi:hypothetical protein